MSDWYQLIGQTVVPLEIDWNDPASVRQLCQVNEPQSRRVAETNVLGVRVSPVFLGLDHGWARLISGRPGKPIVFETMAFWPGEHGEEQTRCAEWSEAEAMHAHMCRHVVSWRARLAWVWRAWSEYWSAARRDFGRRWLRDVRGIPPDRQEALFEEMESRMDAW